ncbi:ATR-interacting protein-like isoform X2 [Mytilus trossulus]
MDKPPAPKKRKVEEEDELWGDDDDDFELTQKDLENLDTEVIASQSVTNGSTYRNNSADPGPSGAARPKLSLSKSGSDRSSMSSGHYQHSFTKPHPVNSSSSSESLNPASTSTSRNNSSCSSEEIPFAPQSRRTSSSHSLDANDQSLTTMYLKNPIVEAEMDKLKQECQRLQRELESAKDDRYSNDGRLKILQQNLSSKDAELGIIRQERAKYIEQQKREQTEKEKNLQTEVDKLTTQLQFKDKELDNFRDRCRTLESASAAGPSVSPVRSPRVSSPLVKKHKTEDNSPKGRSSFPTSQSFMAENYMTQPSTSRAGYKPVETRDEGTMATEQPIVAESSTPRNFRLKLRCPRGDVPGVELLADLLDSDLGTEKSGEEKGIVGLLQKRTSVVDLQFLQFDRDSSNLLSPVHNKRVLDLKHQPSSIVSPEKPVKKAIISPDSYSSAIHGMKCLLRNQQTFQSRSETNIVLTENTLNGAILILPMIDDYLTQYIEMLRINLDARTCVSPRSSFTSSGSSKSSFDSSIQSLTGSLDMLLKDSADFANNLENMALVTLQVLHKLVSFSAVIRNILLNVEKGPQPMESTDEGEQPMETDRSSPESSLDSDWSISSEKFSNLQVLKKVIKIADCGQKERWYNSLVVQKCFDILIVLGTNSTEEKLRSLQPENIGRVLINALDCRTDKQMVLCALHLISTLVQYNKVVSSLCICTEGCVLLNMYQACTDLILTETDESMLVIGKLVLEILLSIQNVHKGGIVLLCEAGCNCSIKVVQTVVLLVHKLLNIYENSQNQSILDDIIKGLQLLHIMSQKQNNFAENHFHVEHQYVQFVCGLLKVLKDFPGNYESEIIAIGDLWDFNQDDSELIQESDDEPS